MVSDSLRVGGRGMIGLDWMLLALVASFVAAAGGASLLGRPRAAAGSSRRPEADHQGLWSIAEAAWVGGRRPPLGRPAVTSGRPEAERLPAVRAAMVQAHRTNEGAMMSRTIARDDGRRTARLLRARRLVDRW